MIYQSSLPIKAWLDPRTRRLPGISPVAMSDWLYVDDAYDAQMAYRRELVAQKRDVVFQAQTGSDAACAELRALIVSETGHEATGNDHPLIEAGLSVQEDLCILQKQGDRHILTAGLMCFPSSWLLSQKIGHNLARIHDPVPEFSPVGATVERMLNAIRVEQPLMRANFLIYTDPELHQPRAEGVAKPINPAGPRFVRVERQTFRRLPKTLAVVFAIHTFIMPANRLSDEAHAALAKIKPDLLPR